jgi:hypothetical protein
MTGDSRIRVGIFPYDQDRLDDVLSDAVDAGLALSREEKWQNLFVGRGAIARGFDHIREQSGMDNQPHVCLVPAAWTEKRLEKLFGVGLTSRYRECCRLMRASVKCPVFLSRPDLVGMYTQFMGGHSGILFHNVKLGMSFCPSR